MSKKYSIEIIVNDLNEEYGDKQTLESFFGDQLGIIARTLNLDVTFLNVKDKR